MWKIYVFDTISLWQDMRHPQKGSMKRFSFTWRIALELFFAVNSKLWHLRETSTQCLPKQKEGKAALPQFGSRF